MTWRIGHRRHRNPRGHINILNVSSWSRLLKTVGWVGRIQFKKNLGILIVFLP